jgi:glutaredoxin-like protein NrdH
MTKRVLDRNDISYNTIDLSKDDEAMKVIKSLGYSSAPVVMAGEEHWSGFRLDKLSALNKAS